jgi:hypothetical protein
MHACRTLRLAFSLLMALMLPLQSAAAMASCEGREAAGREAAANAAAPMHAHHCRSKSAVTHHHDCGSGCCAAAVVSMHADWPRPPRAAGPGLAAVPAPPPTVLIDRLDRPPRSFHA